MARARQVVGLGRATRRPRPLRGFPSSNWPARAIGTQADCYDVMPTIYNRSPSFKVRHRACSDGTTWPLSRLSPYRRAPARGMPWPAACRCPESPSVPVGRTGQLEGGKPRRGRGRLVARPSRPTWPVRPTGADGDASRTQNDRPSTRHSNKHTTNTQTKGQTPSAKKRRKDLPHRYKQELTWPTSMQPSCPACGSRSPTRCRTTT